jgi:transposase InsO family protein
VPSVKIASIHKESEGLTGRRVHQVLHRQDTGCGKRRVVRLMRAAGLEGRRKKRWRTTTVADPAAEAARDLIGRDFVPRPGTGRRYVDDIQLRHSFVSILSAQESGSRTSATRLGKAHVGHRDGATA